MCRRKKPEVCIQGSVLQAANKETATTIAGKILLNNRWGIGLIFGFRKMRHWRMAAKYNKKRCTESDRFGFGSPIQAPSGEPVGLTCIVKRISTQEGVPSPVSQ